MNNTQALTRCCNRCNNPVWEEHDEDLKHEYDYYCPNCDENMFSIETNIRNRLQRGHVKWRSVIIVGE